MWIDMGMNMDQLDKERPRTARKVNRIKDLYLYIKKHGPLTAKELQEEFGMTIRTVERDLTILGYNELIFKPKKGYWQVTNKKVKDG